MPKRKAQELAPDSEPDNQQDEENEHVSGDGSDGTDEDGSSCPEVTSEEEESEDEEGEEAFDEMNVDFQFFDPQESDFHGLKALLVNYLDGEEYNSSDLVDTIIKQSTVGTVVKTAEDEDPIGLITVLNTSRYCDSPAMKSIYEFISKSCKDPKLKEQLQDAWQTKGTGFIVNERLLNTPPQIAPPLLQALREEMAWAAEDEPTEELRQSFTFKTFILLASIFIDSSIQTSGSHTASSSYSPDSQAIVYIRPEDEFVHKHCRRSFIFASQNRAIRADGMQPHRLILLIDAVKMAQVQADIDSVVGNAAAQ